LEEGIVNAIMIILRYYHDEADNYEKSAMITSL
jgi:hypothetical protein